MMYNKIVEDCFFTPRHIGVLNVVDPLTVCVRSGFAEKGTLIDFYLQCSAQGIIEQVYFKARGGPLVIAALEWVCRQIVGQGIINLPLTEYKVLVDILDIPGTQYPVAIQVEKIVKDVVVLMNERLKGYKS